MSAAAAPPELGWVLTRSYDRWVLTGSWDGTAKLWDAATGREGLTLKGHTGWVSAVAFAPDGRRVLTGSEDGTAKPWEAATGREVLTLNDTRAV